MKKLLLTLLIAMSGLFATTQTFPYNNEWIDYGKTYYKFSVGTTGLYRISQATLTSIGIGNTPAEHFQLWRNGREVALYTSVSSGPLGGADFIEFWGEKNDGRPDSTLYRDPSYILSNKHSFQTDTAAFFLTVNPAGGNLRMQETVNNVAGNILPPEPYFMFTEGKYYKSYINTGYYIDAGEYVHSSSYDRGESWVCWDIYPGQLFSETHTLYPYMSGPDATFRINLFGNGINLRQFKIGLNTDSIYGQQLDYLSQAKVSANVPLTTLINGTNTIQISNYSANPYDRLVVAQYELVYPRIFNFGDTINFEFELAANPSGNYLEITNFNYGSTAPVLYDITNGKRYSGDISNPALLKFALEPSLVARKLILISLDPANILAVGTFKTRNFVNYNLAANQGDYVIISHSSLFAGPGGSNPVENYRAYRSSLAGGAYNAKIFDIDELVDQFAFGIKKHPNSIRNFLRWGRTNFSVAPKFVFMIGHAVVYDQYRYAEATSDIEKLNIVPTFGTPASDILLSAEVRSQIPVTPIGRLSVINGAEIAAYLAKVQEYEAAQASSSPLVQDKAWMKNVVHVMGGSEDDLVAQLTGYMNKYKQIISDTLFGGNVTTFKKTSAEAVQQLGDQQMKTLFAEGISQLVYFGHSSATVLDFNLDNPEQYNNPGKYPLFIAMGCLAGNFFNYNAARFYTKETLSERWLLTPNRGAIAFLASSHFGIPHYLDIYNTKTYTNESRNLYGRTYGEILKQAIADVFTQTSQLDFYARMHTEQNTFHGDPALRPNTHPKPDYVIEDPMVRISPSFITIADLNFKVDARYINMGRAINKEIAIKVERTLPSGVTVLILKDTIPGIRFQDSISISIAIDPITDKGLNKITVTIDADNVVDELYETNNTITKDVFIFEDDAKPVYPSNYAIINKQNIVLYASTANPLSASKQYRMEIDTTTFFNSSLKRTVNITSVGGLLEFNPGITFTDSTVYYWRVSPLDATGNPSKWNEASFIYLPNSDVGSNQSHFYQHTKSLSQRVFIDSNSRRWDYHSVTNYLFVRNGVYPTSSPWAADYYINVNGENIVGPGCGYNELIINVFDPISFRPMQNTTGDLYGTYTCQGMAYDRQFNFIFPIGDTASRRKAREFLENIVPEGAYVTIRSGTYPYPGVNTYASVWKADTAYYGPGISLYHTLKDQGFTSIDNYDTTNAFVFVYKKNSLATYTPSIRFGENIYDRILMNVACPTPDTLGYTTSPAFGAAKQWKQLKWRGSTVDAVAGDLPTIDLIGLNSGGGETTVMSNLDLSQQDVDISSIDAAQYPYLKIRMRNIDSVNLTPYQLRYWRLTYVPVPEGAIAPNIFLQFKDTLDPGEPLDFKLAFKNISDGNFDSLKVKMIVTDRNNQQSPIQVGRFRPLPGSDTLHVRYPISTAGLTGQNTFYLDVNPDNDQPEQFHFNNFMYRNFYVRSDNVNPLLDVTFDGVHILNRDIVASKPHIMIKLKDESKWLILNDTSGARIEVRYPNGVKRSFFFNTNDTLKFTPAGNAPNPDNTATIDFLPYFPLDGDYELTVTGKDKSGNTAGNIEYKVAFQVINKPMISNMLNYPNPFTTSTAFVFTITGAEVPQNIRIQIMTITGKIVREITKDELGPLHIGRNI
ncbi:MAG TPA: C25 family cysteine peptidase, partial [Flavitalea sp.]|nr:C25 family cysteine peptidase [Flavitalea sp.]